MTLKDSSLLKHMGLPHVLRDLGILNQYCNTYLNTLDLRKKFQTVTTRWYTTLLCLPRVHSLYLISYGYERKFTVKAHGMAICAQKFRDFERILKHLFKYFRL